MSSRKTIAESGVTAARLASKAGKRSFESILFDSAYGVAYLTRTDVYWDCPVVANVGVTFDF